MENNPTFQRVVATITQLEQDLAELGVEALEKYDEEITREIEEHFSRCLNALASRKETLLRELKELIRNQKSEATKSQKELRASIEVHNKMKEAGAISFAFDCKTAEAIWKGIESLPRPQRKERVEVVLPTSFLSAINSHGTVAIQSNSFVVPTTQNQFSATAPPLTEYTVAKDVSVISSSFESNASSVEYYYGICWNPNDSCFYFCDHGTHTIKKVTTEGFVSTVWKAHGLDSPHGIAINYATNDVYITSQNSHSVVKISKGIFSTIACNDKKNSNGFSSPNGIALDQQTGILYFVDHGNHRIQTISDFGEVFNLAGSNYGDIDGVGPGAKFASPWGICFDAIDRCLLVCDYGNNKIKRVLLGGKVTTVCEIPGPTFIAAAASAFLVSSCGTNKIFRVTRDGHVSSIEVDGRECFLKSPRGLALHEESHSCYVVTDRTTIKRISFEN